jgi:hypothetical protein
MIVGVSPNGLSNTLGAHLNGRTWRRFTSPQYNCPCRSAPDEDATWASNAPRPSNDADPAKS